MSDIQHIVISGGGMAGIIEYGIIKHLIDKKKINMENINSIYGNILKFKSKTKINNIYSLQNYII